MLNLVASTDAKLVMGSPCTLSSTSIQGYAQLELKAAFAGDFLQVEELTATPSGRIALQNDIHVAATQVKGKVREREGERVGQTVDFVFFLVDYGDGTAEAAAGDADGDL